jgi:hypothetical protein
VGAVLPDYRGEFLRGWDNGRGVDPGRVVGSSQGDELRRHNHGFVKYKHTADSGGSIGIYHYWDTGQAQRTSYTTETGGDETRPRNVAVTYIIRSR